MERGSDGEVRSERGRDNEIQITISINWERCL